MLLYIYNINIVDNLYKHIFLLHEQNNYYNDSNSFVKKVITI